EQICRAVENHAVHLDTPAALLERVPGNLDDWRTVRQIQAGSLVGAWHAGQHVLREPCRCVAEFGEDGIGPTGAGVGVRDLAAPRQVDRIERRCALDRLVVYEVLPGTEDDGRTGINA